MCLVCKRIKMIKEGTRNSFWACNSDKLFLMGDLITAFT